MTIPLAFTGDYVEGDYDPETGETGPSYVRICVNGQEAVHLKSSAGWLAPREQQYEVQEVFIQFLQEVLLRHLTSPADPA